MGDEQFEEFLDRNRDLNPAGYIANVVAQNIADQRKSTKAERDSTAETLEVPPETKEETTQ